MHSTYLIIGYCLAWWLILNWADENIPLAEIIETLKIYFLFWSITLITILTIFY